MIFIVTGVHRHRKYNYTVSTVDWERFHCVKESFDDNLDGTGPPETFTLLKGEQYEGDNDQELKLQLLEEISHFFHQYGTVLRFPFS